MLEKLIKAAKALDDQVGDYLDENPSARIAHHRNALLDALQREKAAEAEAIAKAAAREARRAENDRDRRRRSWEPHQIRAAENMGFTDPAEWRKYIDEREAFRETGPYVEGAEFPSPEEWRARRGQAPPG